MSTATGQCNRRQPNKQPCIFLVCDMRGTLNATDEGCICKENVIGPLCNVCKWGFRNISLANPEGCQGKFFFIPV